MFVSKLFLKNSRIIVIAAYLSFFNICARSVKHLDENSIENSICQHISEERIKETLRNRRFQSLLTNFGYYITALQKRKKNVMKIREKIEKEPQA